MIVPNGVGSDFHDEFIDNPEPRCPIVLMLDVSRSMEGRKFDTLKHALTKFRDIIRGDLVTALRADVAVISFASTAQVIQDFTNGTDFEPCFIKLDDQLDDTTRFSTAINLVLDIIQARKQTYRSAGTAYYRGLVYFFTDGEPKHDSGADLALTAARLSKMQEGRSVAFFCIGIGWPDRPADLLELAKLAPLQLVELINTEQLNGSIQWLTNSVFFEPLVGPPERVRLPDPDFLDF